MSVMTCRVSLYPLDVPDSSAAVASVLERMSWGGLEVSIDPMGTFVRGEEDQVLARVEELYRLASASSACVLTVTLSNRCGCR